VVVEAMEVEAVAGIAAEAMADTPALADGAVTTTARPTWISDRHTIVRPPWTTATVGIGVEPSKIANSEVASWPNL
jgi:hypothetical protein